MIVFRHGQLSKKEKKIILGILYDFADAYSDFYITRSNLRLYIKENQELLFKILREGDKMTFSENEGIALIVGFSDRSPRKYIKILAKNKKSADKLLKVALWNIQENLFIKIKKNNPIKEILQKNNFRFKGDRGDEILFCRQYKNPKKQLQGE